MQNLFDILMPVTTLALVFVLLSAGSHATWNFLLKRSHNREVFTWWMLMSISLLMIPLGVTLAWREPVVYPGWWFILGTTILHVVYFLILARSYTGADLSIVYPIARGMGPALVPILGMLILLETISPMGVFGIAIVVVGIYTVYWWGQIGHILRDPLRFLREPGARYAILTGFVIAAYSIWDKVGVGYVHPFLYLYFFTLGSALALGPYMLRAHGMAAIRAEWRTGATSIIAAGALAFLAYGLILTALTFSRVSYIAPAREVGIVVAVLLGTLVLKEPFGRGRLMGSSLIVGGLILIAVAP